MIARGMMLVFAGEPARAYATGGALKPTHAVTMHAILVLPALAWLLSFADWSEWRRRQVVLVASAGYVGLALLVATTNIAGLELQQLPILADTLLALGAIAVLAAGAVALRGVAHFRAPADSSTASVSLRLPQARKVPLMRDTQRDEIRMIDAQFVRNAVNFAFFSRRDRFVCH